jgi:hypothetical protein
MDTAQDPVCKVILIVPVFYGRQEKKQIKLFRIALVQSKKFVDLPE